MSIKKCVFANTTRLMDACSSNHHALVNMLINYGEDVNHRLRVVDLLLNPKPDDRLGISTEILPILLCEGSTALMFAAAKGNVNIAYALVKAGGKIDLQNDKGYNAIMVAAFYGHFRVMEFLARNDADVNLRLKNGRENALMIACVQGHLKCVKFLWDITEFTFADLEVALKNVTANGHKEVALFLIHASVPVDPSNNICDSPLMIAVYTGRFDLVFFYLRHGADINYMTSMGSTALIEAAESEDEEMIVLLLNEGANINACSNETALGVACRKGFYDIAKLLLRSGANVELGTPPPLDLAIATGHLKLICLLLRADAEVRSMNPGILWFPTCKY